MTALFSDVYQQFWIKTGSKTLTETCFCQDGLNLGLNHCWQKLANTAMAGARFLPYSVRPHTLTAVTRCDQVLSAVNAG